MDCGYGSENGGQGSRLEGDHSMVCNRSNPLCCHTLVVESPFLPSQNLGPFVHPYTRSRSCCVRYARLWHLFSPRVIRVFVYVVFVSGLFLYHLSSSSVHVKASSCSLACKGVVLVLLIEVPFTAYTGAYGITTTARVEINIVLLSGTWGRVTLGIIVLMNIRHVQYVISFIYEE
ncbi:hypothetical protein BDY19DRAFT_688952 [Irpex rosettiformis]|uniref:Uncharacterized protein n=1 Tax=Irpex rosettiformis TaxID=378272 RepID=A0ACB8UA68_9APHY|nr:hypothetical protein BDY19DRAFT_688952 [Irpex rosettiformis]